MIDSWGIPNPLLEPAAQDDPCTDIAGLCPNAALGGCRGLRTPPRKTGAFRRAGRQRSYRDTTMVTTLAPCWYCSGLILQFSIGRAVVGEPLRFRGGIDWLREMGVAVVDLQSDECMHLLGEYIHRHPDVWAEDIGRECQTTTCAGRDHSQDTD